MTSGSLPKESKADELMAVARQLDYLIGQVTPDEFAQVTCG
ncbi:MAG TPA: hypothetical protein VFQ44_04275 [Streptosporangiaceae bacterium]|nr:hypothetical protein [Streptosporangiaceae bacterium]